MGAFTGVGTPRPISSRNLELWISALNLDVDAASKLRRTVDDSYEAREQSIAAIIRPVKQVAAATAFRDLMKVSNHAVARLWAIEEELFRMI